MTHKYYIVIGFNIHADAWELIFGDYDHIVAYEERDDVRDGWSGNEYHSIQVVTLSQDNQAAIDTYIATLNRGE